MTTEFTELMKLDIDGESFTVLGLDNPIEVQARSPVKVAMVAETPEELITRAAYTEACEMLFASVRRRGITPNGSWCVAALPVDWPLWRESVHPDLARQVAAKVAEINGHVTVYALLDTATIKPRKYD